MKEGVKVGVERAVLCKGRSIKEQSKMPNRFQENRQGSLGSVSRASVQFSAVRIGDRHKLNNLQMVAIPPCP